MSPFLFAAAAVVSAATSVPSQPAAQIGPAAASAPGLRQDVMVPLDAATPVRLPSAAQGVVIGNPSIAGVSVQNDRLLFVTGKSYGSTNIIVVGARGEAIFQGRINVIADETNAVMLTRGSAMVRYDCAPLCRRRQDLSDEPSAFSALASLISGHANSAAAGK